MKQLKDVLPFQNRWVISGTLTTRGPLHIGDGGEALFRDRIPPDQSKRQGTQEIHDSTYSTVCVDCKGKPYLVGSTIKGALRARVAHLLQAEQQALANWWKANGRKQEAQRDPKPPCPWTDLLGADDADADWAEGGKVEFNDAFISADITPRTNFPQRREDTRPWHRNHEQTGAPPFWNLNRLTGVAVSVSLDRRTRTAKDKFLYHLEYVPAGVSFNFELTGENLSDEDVAKLLALLDTFNDPIKPVTLGAQASNSWGLIEWKRGPMKCFTANDLVGWLNAPTRTGYEMCNVLSDGDIQKIEEKKRKLSIPSNLLTIELTLHFPGPLLVRDPQQKLRSAEAPDTLPQDQKPPDATPVLDTNGFPCIPEKSARGVLRARAEMILRTLGHHVPEPSDHSKFPKICGRADLEKLDPASKIFGASGWRAPIQISAFTWADRDDPRWLRQEFVAIDRFTGGAAPEKKFNANAVVGAKLKGKITLDLDRLKACGADQYAEGLLALVLRDLAEGDLTFGSGAAKGYGECKIVSAKITRTTPPTTYSTLDDWFAAAGTSLEALRDLPLHSPQPQQETAHA